MRYTTSQLGEEVTILGIFAGGRDTANFVGPADLTFAGGLAQTITRSVGDWGANGFDIGAGGGQGIRIRGTASNNVDVITEVGTSTAAVLHIALDSPNLLVNEGPIVGFNDFIGGEVVAEAFDITPGPGFDTLLPLNDPLAAELQAGGYYAWRTTDITTPPVAHTQIFVVLTDLRTAQEHPTKFVVGGFPDESKVAAYGGMIHFNSATGTSGSVFGVNGTPASPSDNLADVLLLLTASGFTQVRVTGVLTINANVDGLRFIGFDPFTDSVVLDVGNSVVNSAFTTLTMRDAGGVGAGQSGSIGNAEDCTLASSGVDGYRGVDGSYVNCNALMPPSQGGLVFADGAQVLMSRSFTSGVTNAAPPEDTFSVGPAGGLILDFSAATTTTVVAIEKAVGFFQAIGLSEGTSTVLFTMDDAQLVLLSSMANCLECVVLGEGIFQDNSTKPAFHVVNLVHDFRYARDSQHIDRGVWLDTENGAPNAFPGVTGVFDNPVDSLANALLLMAARLSGGRGIGRNYPRLYARKGTGTITLTSTFEDREIVGIGAGVVVNLGSQDVDGARFVNVELTGTALAGSVFDSEDCVLNGVTNLAGTHTRPVLRGTNTRDSGAAVLKLIESASGEPGTTQPVLDVNGTGGEFHVRGHRGGLDVRNVADANHGSIDLQPGTLTFGVTNATGSIVLRGHGERTLTGAATVDETGFLRGSLLDDSISNVITAIGNLNDLDIADVQTALTNQGYTSGRAPNLDNLDATVSGVPAAILASLLTSGETVDVALSRLDNIDTEVTTNIPALIAALENLSIADVESALTNQGYTTARAVLLDNLDASVSSVLTAIAGLENLSAAGVTAAVWGITEAALAAAGETGELLLFGNTLRSDVDFTGSDLLGWQLVIFDRNDTEIARANLFDEAFARIPSTTTVSAFIAAQKAIARVDII